MAGSLESILGYVTLTKAVKETTSGIPSRFPDPFFKVTEKTLKDRGRYVQFTGERRTSKLSKYGSPAHEADLRGVKERDIRLLHSFEKQPLDPLTLKYLRQPASYEHDKGLEEVKRQVFEFSKKIENLRVATMAMVLRTGLLYWDGDGNLLPTSSGATESHDFQLHANNLNQLNGIIAASWALNSTDIPLQLRNLRRRAAKDTGLPLKYAFYGQSVPSYLTQNDFVLDYLSRSNKREEYLFSETGEIPDGLFGFTWVPVYEMFWEDSGGTNQDLWATDAVVFTPEVSDEWWGFMEGSYEVPKTIDIAGGGAAAMGNCDTVYGMFSYGQVITDPVTVMHFAGDTFAPLMKLPGAVFSADVAF